MANRVQIAIKDAGATRWKLLAHGAAYDRDAADMFKATREAMGDKVRFLPLGKGE